MIIMYKVHLLSTVVEGTQVCFSNNILSLQSMAFFKNGILFLSSLKSFIKETFLIITVLAGKASTELMV